VRAEPPTLSLYHRRFCAYCLDVRREIARLGLSVELRDVSRSEAERRELLRQLGRPTVPVLRIESSDGEVTWLSESLDIIEYLARLRPGARARSRLQVRLLRWAPLAGLGVALALPPTPRAVLLALSAALFASRVWLRRRG
jgi:glutathione S-transferase